MIEHDDKGPMQPPQRTDKVMKGAPAADSAKPGDTTDAERTESGKPVPNTDQEAG